MSCGRIGISSEIGGCSDIGLFLDRFLGFRITAPCVFERSMVHARDRLDILLLHYVLVSFAM